MSAFFSGIENIPFFRCGTEYIDLLIRAVGIQAGAELEIGSIVRAQLATVRTVGNSASGDHMGAWSAEHGAGFRFACGSLGITRFQRCHQVPAARNQAHRALPACQGTFALAGAFGRPGSDSSSSSLCRERSLLSILPEEAVKPAICRAGSMVAIPSIVTVRTFSSVNLLWWIREVGPKQKSAFLFLFERTASERAMYGEKCFGFQQKGGK